MNSNSKVKKVVSIIFAFLMFLGITGAAVSGAVLFTVCNENTVYRALDDSDYISSSFRMLRRDMRAEADSHKLPMDVVMNSLDKNDFAKALKGNIKNNMQGKPSIDSHAIAYASALEQDMYAYIEDNGAKTNDRIDGTIDEICQNAQKYYHTYSTLPFTETFSEKYGTLKKPLGITGGLSLTLALVSVIMIAVIHKSRRNSAVYLSAGFLASGVSTGISGYLINGMANYDLAGTMTCYRMFVTSFYGKTGPVLYTIGTILILLAVVGYLFMTKSKKA